MPSFGERIVKAWNAFRNKDPTARPEFSTGYGSYSPPDRRRLRRGSERSIIAPLLNRISVDASSIELKHVRLDEEGRYKEDIADSLNEILTVEANIDQSARAFRQDIYMSLLDEGYIAICPIDADVDPDDWTVNSFQSVRVGKILQWYPRHVEVEVYDDRSGQRKTIRQPKSMCSIVQNPFYEIMNAPNSVLMRLRQKLAMLDELDAQTTSGKLDLIIQLPYSTRSAVRKEQADERRKDIEFQLAGSKYGIAYIDSTEHVIQLNRSLDNNLVPQIESLTKQLLDQIGISPEILNGSADDVAKNNYLNDVIEPLVTALVDELKRKWISKQERARGQSIMFFKDPFRLMPVSKIADMADKFTRNEIMSSNEFRVKCGLKPSDQPGADELRNKNLNQSNVQAAEGAAGTTDAAGLTAEGMTTPEEAKALGLSPEEAETLRQLEQG